MNFNANRLLTMINQLLDIRKSEAGLMNLHVSKGNIVEFANEITASFKNLANQRNIRLHFSAQQDEIEAWFDHDQLEKVLYNLLSNAFKFTKDHGQVKVDVKKPGPIEISVHDTGIGIPQTQLQNIFDRFYQVEDSQELTRKNGAGIGLSLAKVIMEKHRGQIKVTSEEGVGTTFSVLLQTGNAHFKKSELLPEENTPESLIGTSFPIHVDALTPEAAKKEVKIADRPHQLPLVLIVEDNQNIRTFLRENLESNYRIKEASDGLDGLERALADPPDLIISDIAMPRMDGMELCRRVKSNIDTSHIPVILLTARTSLVYKVDGFEKGADDYITKPFNMRLLAARIKNLIESRRALREQFSKTFDLSPSHLVLNSLDEELLSQIKNVVDKHIDDSNFSVEKLASALNMSRTQLYRKLKSLTGKSPNQIIRSFRLERAAQLLKSGQYNVSDVTYMVGYNDLKSFREQFKKEYDVSPSEYGSNFLMNLKFKN
jgi:DNA-binding response OmpR family regulator/two-component sensor histidine kinase